jgi:hypothetical protein
MTWACTSFCSSARTIANRSNLAGHWVRIGVVGAQRAVWRAGSIILAGIIKHTPDSIPIIGSARNRRPDLTWIAMRSNASAVVQVFRLPR